MVKDWNKRCEQFALNLYNKRLLKTEEEHDLFLAWCLTKEEAGGRGLDKLSLLKAYKVSEKLKNNFDHFTVIVGKEGLGKSTYAINYCACISPTFSIKHICYNQKDLINVLPHVQPGESILMDEGLQFLFSRKAMKGTNVDMIEIISMMRQLNIHVCIAVPNFFNLETYIREHRVNTLIQILSRGKYKLISEQAARWISAKGKNHKAIEYVKLRSTEFARGDFYDQFPNMNDLNLDNYKKLKRDNFDSNMLAFKEKIEGGFMNFKQAGDAIGVSDETVRRKVHSGDIPSIIVGKRKMVPKSYVDHIYGEAKKLDY